MKPDRIIYKGNKVIEANAQLIENFKKLHEQERPIDRIVDRNVRECIDENIDALEKYIESAKKRNRRHALDDQIDNFYQTLIEQAKSVNDDGYYDDYIDEISSDYDEFKKTAIISEEFIEDEVVENDEISEEEIVDDEAIENGEISEEEIVEDEAIENDEISEEAIVEDDAVEDIREVKSQAAYKYPYPYWAIGKDGLVSKYFRGNTLDELQKMDIRYKGLLKTFLAIPLIGPASFMIGNSLMKVNAELWNHVPENVQTWLHEANEKINSFLNKPYTFDASGVWSDAKGNVINKISNIKDVIQVGASAAIAGTALYGFVRGLGAIKDKLCSFFKGKGEPTKDGEKPWNVPSETPVEALDAPQEVPKLGPGSDPTKNGNGENTPVGPTPINTAPAEPTSVEPTLLEPNSEEPIILGPASPQTSTQKNDDEKAEQVQKPYIQVGDKIVSVIPNGDGHARLSEHDIKAMNQQPEENVIPNDLVTPVNYPSDLVPEKNPNDDRIAWLKERKAQAENILKSPLDDARREAYERIVDSINKELSKLEPVSDDEYTAWLKERKAQASDNLNSQLDNTRKEAYERMINGIDNKLEGEGKTL